MYIIRTLHGDIKADFDEIEKIVANPAGGLIFLRNGAVNIRHITNIVLDEERMKEVVKRPGQTDAVRQKEIDESRSVDIFAKLRNKTVDVGNRGGPVKLLP